MIKILIKHLNQTLSEGLVVELKDILHGHDFVFRDTPSIYESTASIILKRNGNADGMPYYHEIEQINA